MPPFSPGDILITLRTCGDLRRGDVVTVSHTSPSGEYVYLDERGGRQAFRSDAFLLAVRRPWHAWADPEWERRAREAAERFVREGLPTKHRIDANDVTAAARALVESEQAWGIQYGDARCIWCGASPADPYEDHGDGCVFGALVRAIALAALAEKETSR